MVAMADMAEATAGMAVVATAAAMAVAATVVMVATVVAASEDMAAASDLEMVDLEDSETDLGEDLDFDGLGRGWRRVWWLW